MFLKKKAGAQYDPAFFFSWERYLVKNLQAILIHYNPFIAIAPIPYLIPPEHCRIVMRA
jgi:hypothetical protein